MSSPPLTVLIPWYKRDELARTLAANAVSFRSLQAEVLVLNCGGDSARLSALIRASGAAGVRQLDIAAAEFNKSLALNLGLEQSRAEVVFTLDADIILRDECLRELYALPDEQSFSTVEWVYESESPAPHQGQDLRAPAPKPAGDAFLELRFRNGRSVQHQLVRRDAFGNRYAAPGLLLARKRDLLDIAGYNSELKAWGWEDDDVVIRLQYARGLRRVLKGSAQHLTHGDDRRALKRPRGMAAQANLVRCCRNYNRGDFAGTYRADTQWAADKVREQTQSCEPVDESA